jgi:CubicO group peptidase (beta-lactamase class C family)
MEAALGKSLADIVTERIWGPLGMESTSFGEDTAHRYRVADQYIYEGGEILPTTNECKLKITENFHSLGAGIVTSVDDYMRFLDCLAAGGVSSRGVRIMSENAVRLLEVPRLAPRPLECFRRWNPIYGGYSYGIGVRVMVEPSAYDGRIPKGEFGWNGACGHYGLVDRKNGISVFYAEHVFKHTPVANVTVHPKVRSFAYDIAGL